MPVLSNTLPTTMTHAKRITIVAGEASGDIHAAHLIRQLLAVHPKLIIQGLGGQHMQAAGANVLFDLAAYGVTGLTEVLLQMRVINKAFRIIRASLIQTPPDLLILIDYPGFNLRLARFAKQRLHLKILYYISPQIWAWKANRLHTIKRYVDRMAVIFPFEKTLYEKAHVPVSFVGHPLVAQIKPLDALTIRRQFNLPSGHLVAFLPGSRLNEIKYHMPVFIKAMQTIYAHLPDVTFVIPIASTLPYEKIACYVKHLPIPVYLIKGHAQAIAACSNAVVVASGTASLECALLQKPMCIVYKASLLTYVAAMKLLRVKYIGLCNLLKNRMIVPELLQDDCNAHELSQVVIKLLTQTAYRNHLTQSLNKLSRELSLESADISLADLVCHMLYAKQVC